MSCLAACAETAASRGGTAGPPPGIWHQVKEGEGVTELASRYRIPAEDIVEINGLPHQPKLGAGQVVFLPGARVAAIEPRQSSRPATTPPPRPPVGPGKLLWPVPGGKLTSRYGPRGRRPHEGIDIAAAEGTRVLAAAAGTVIYAGSGVRGYGNLLLLRHPGGLVTVYAHNRRNLVSEKEAVQRGQVIAEVGHTGNASANHLHFEVRRGEIPEDPLLHVAP